MQDFLKKILIRSFLFLCIYPITSYSSSKENCFDKKKLSRVEKSNSFLPPIHSSYPGEKSKKNIFTIYDPKVNLHILEEELEFFLHNKERKIVKRIFLKKHAFSTLLMMSSYHSLMNTITYKVASSVALKVSSGQKWTKSQKKAWNLGWRAAWNHAYSISNKGLPVEILENQERSHKLESEILCEKQFKAEFNSIVRKEVLKISKNSALYKAEALVESAANYADSNALLNTITNDIYLKTLSNLEKDAIRTLFATFNGQQISDPVKLASQSVSTSEKIVHDLFWQEYYQDFLNEIYDVSSQSLGADTKIDIFKNSKSWIDFSASLIEEENLSTDAMKLLYPWLDQLDRIANEIDSK